MINDQIEQIYIKYHQSLFLYAFSLCKDYHLAQDLTADTFLKAYLSLDDLSYIKYWLFRVCKNLYFDYLRKSREVSGDDLEITPVSNESPLDKLIDSENKKYLYEKIINLKESYK